jgi:hypothetical protein
MFLTAEEVAQLTGYRRRSKQVEALRQMGIPFFVNLLGHPIVPRSVVEGRANQPPPRQKWHPKAA